QALSVAGSDVRYLEAVHRASGTSSCSNLAFILSRYCFSFRLCAFFPTSDRFGSNVFDTIFCG
ncbi:hypothetical protein BDV37DRAFT_266399, partial [Aspergillus pseudonomiae]